MKRGSLIKDIWGRRGIIVKIVEGYDNENHGSIKAWMMDEYEYGADNCEDYVYFGWEKAFKVIEE